MSLFSTIETDCPVCGVTARYELVFSVNADRRPELRARILDRSFQRLTCEACGAAFRIQPRFTYIHAGGHLFLSAWPAGDLERWPERLAQSEAAFGRVFGEAAGPAAAGIGRELARRVVFGWEAVREKLVAADAGIDDATLELAKLALLRTQDDIPTEGAALRLMGVDEAGQLVIAIVEDPDEQVGAHFLVPRALLDEISADAEAWAPLRARLAETPLVEARRLLTVPEPA